MEQTQDRLQICQSLIRNTCISHSLVRFGNLVSYLALVRSFT